MMYDVTTSVAHGPRGLEGPRSTRAVQATRPPILLLAKKRGDYEFFRAAAGCANILTT